MAIAKLAAWAFTQSSAMLSESVHSIADCTNEIVLMAGGRVARKKRKNRNTPLVGSASNTWHRSSWQPCCSSWAASSRQARPSRRSPKCSPISRHEWRTGGELVVALIVVVISACLEGYGLHQSVKESNERMRHTGMPHMGIYRFWRVTKSADLASVIMETRSH